MLPRGRSRTLKFRIGTHGNPAYDALKNLDGIALNILKEQEFNCFEEYYIIVNFEEFGATPFNPDAHGPMDPRDAETPRGGEGE